MTKEDCLRRAADNLQRHQMGFEGEAIGLKVIKKDLARKGVKGTRHKHPFDVITEEDAWEIKTVGADAKDIKMTVKGNQKIKKEAWAKANDKDPKSMLIVINDKIDIYTRDGVGGFRPGTMEKLGTFEKEKI